MTKYYQKGIDWFVIVWTCISFMVTGSIIYVIVHFIRKFW